MQERISSAKNKQKDTEGKTLKVLFLASDGIDADIYSRKYIGQKRRGWGPLHSEPLYIESDDTKYNIDVFCGEDYVQIPRDIIRQNNIFVIVTPVNDLEKLKKAEDILESISGAFSGKMPPVILIIKEPLDITNSNPQFPLEIKRLENSYGVMLGAARSTGSMEVNKGLAEMFDDNFVKALQRIEQNSLKEKKNIFKKFTDVFSKGKGKDKDKSESSHVIEDSSSSSSDSSSLPENYSLWLKQDSNVPAEDSEMGRFIAMFNNRSGVFSLSQAIPSQRPVLQRSSSLSSISPASFLNLKESENRYNGNVALLEAIIKFHTDELVEFKQYGNPSEMIRRVCTPNILKDDELKQIVKDAFAGKNVEISDDKEEKLISDLKEINMVANKNGHTLHLKGNPRQIDITRMVQAACLTFVSDKNPEVQQVQQPKSR
jgi:hypothetical protein